MTNEIPAVFHNMSNYDCHFIIKELANEFKGQFECLGENTEKYKTFFRSDRKRSHKSLQRKKEMKLLKQFYTK